MTNSNPDHIRSRNPDGSWGMTPYEARRMDEMNVLFELKEIHMRVWHRAGVAPAWIISFVKRDGSLGMQRGFHLFDSLQTEVNRIVMDAGDA